MVFKIFISFLLRSRSRLTTIDRVASIIYFVIPCAGGGLNFANTKFCKKPEKLTKTLANGYSYESAQRELSNEYQYDRVQMFFRNLCVIVLWMKVALVLEGLLHER